MPVIFPFGEGKTEKIIFDFLVEKWFSGYQFKTFKSVNGKTKFGKEILKTVQGDLLAGRDEVRILVFRDLDDGEDIDSVAKSFQDIVRSLLKLKSWNFEPNEVRLNNIYKWECAAELASGFAGLSFVLHIANHADGTLPNPLRNQTSDGYILKIALNNSVLGRFARENKVNTSPSILRRLIIEKIPEVISGEGINFDEDKDYLSAYLTASRFWVVKRTEKETRLIKIILERSWTHDRENFEQVFASWRTAIQEVVQ